MLEDYNEIGDSVWDTKAFWYKQLQFYIEPLLDLFQLQILRDTQDIIQYPADL